MQISLPPLLQLTGALLSLQLAKLIQKNHSWAGENSPLACLGTRFSCILLQSLSCRMQLAYLYTWFVLKDGEKEKGNPNHVITTNQTHGILNFKKAKLGISRNICHCCPTDPVLYTVPNLSGQNAALHHLTRQEDSKN